MPKCFDCGKSSIFTDNFKKKKVLKKSTDNTYSDELVDRMSDQDWLCNTCFQLLEIRHAKEVDKTLLETLISKQRKEREVKTTSLLWLAPIFMGILGGILMYIAIKDEDKAKANTAFHVGVISTIIIIIFYASSIGALLR